MRKKVRLKFDSGRKFNEKDIKEFEDKYKIDLPLDYRNFLMEYGETTPEKNLFSYKSLHAQDNFEVRYFHHINNLYFDREEFPENIIAIASTSGDCYVVISVSGDDKGKVYFWEKDYLNEEKPDYSNLFFLADNFEEFLNSFDYPYDSEIYEYIQKGKLKKVKEIIENGFDVNSLDNIGVVLIKRVFDGLYECNGNNPEDVYNLIKLMLDKGANLKNNDVINSASVWGDRGFRFVDLFLEYGDDINKLAGYNPEWKSTPLTSACLTPCPEMIEFLLIKGASPLIKNTQGQKPSEVVKMRIDQAYWSEEEMEKYRKMYDILLEAEKNWKG